MQSRHVDLPATASQGQVEAAVAELSADPDVHGILVQLPLPDGLDPEAVLALIPPEKDVDGLTERSMGRLVRGVPGLVGCTPLGVMRLLERYGVETSGRRAVVVGRSTLVGLPAVAAPGPQGHRRHGHDRPLAAPPTSSPCAGRPTSSSAPPGRPHMITVDHVKPGAAVIDVGVSRTEAGIVGDVDQAAVAEVAGWLTPMPGGTGPMTIACLLENTVTAARLQGVDVGSPVT